MITHQARGNLVDGDDPRREITGESVVEKVDRQSQEGRYTAIAHNNGNPYCQALLTPQLEPRNDINKSARQSGQACNRWPPGSVLSQHPVYIQCQGSWHHKREYGKQQSAHRCEHNRPGRALEPEGQILPQPLTLGPAAHESAGCSELQRNTRIRLGKFRSRYVTAPYGRVQQEEVFSVISFQNHKMVELPEQNQRQLHGLEQLRIAGVPGTFKTIVPGRTQDTCSGAAVPAHLASVAKLR